MALTKEIKIQTLIPTAPGDKEDTIFLSSAIGTKPKIQDMVLP